MADWCERHFWEPLRTALAHAALNPRTGPAREAAFWDECGVVGAYYVEQASHQLDPEVRTMITP
jgi:hypothetical protein